MMSTVPLVVLLASSVYASPLLTRDWDFLVNSINSDPRSTWKATPPSVELVHRSMDLLMGGYKPFNDTLHALPEFKTDYQSDFTVPDSYDARTAFPECASIQTVRDQCGCGSCFAFGALEAFEDRICIHGKKNVTLSVEDIISCHTDENMSCQGGNPIAVWQDILAGSKEGDGAIQESCYPYAIPTCPCNHHSKTSSFPACPAEGKISTPTCDFTMKFACEDKGIFKAQSANLIPSGQMEQELVQNGPITVAFTVFDDFLSYKSGVYQKSESAKALGGHSVKIVGFGVDNGTKYWTVANSWNAEWGNGGFFNILRGTDECYIESSAVVAGLPAVN